MKDAPVVGPAAVCGNGKLLELRRDEDGVHEVRFISEPRSSPQALWFNIEVSELGASAVRFVWDCADTTLGNPAHLDILRPVLKADEGDWRRCEAVQVVDTPDGRRQVVFEQAEPCERVCAAFCYPYAPDDLAATLSDLGDAWERTVIGLTTEGRELPRLRLAGTDSPAEPERPGVYLMARQHAGETPGSWVMDGILRFVAGEDSQAQEYREKVDWWLAPFADLDGVVNGNYGKDALPWDFNRAWEPMPMRPEIHALQRDLRRFAERTQPRLVVDLHGPGHDGKDVFVQLPRDERPEEQKEAARNFVLHLMRQFPELNPEEVWKPTRYASRWNALATVGGWTWDQLEQTLNITVETSYQTLAGNVLEREDYRDIGRRVALAVFEWLAAREGVRAQ